MNRLPYILLLSLAIPSCAKTGQSTYTNENTQERDSLNSTVYTLPIDKLNSDSLFLNEVTGIPSNFCDLTQLRFLSLGGTECCTGDCDGKDLNKLPPCIGSFTELEHIVFSVTGVDHIPDTLRNLKKLTNLHFVDEAGLNDISNINLLPNLENLTFTACNVKNIAEAVKGLKKLKSISIIQCYHIDDGEISRLKKVVPKGCKIHFEKSPE